MSRQSALSFLIGMSVTVLIFLWIWRLASDYAPKTIKIGAWTVTTAMVGALVAFTAYCIWVVLIGGN